MHKSASIKNHNGNIEIHSPPMQMEAAAAQIARDMRAREQYTYNIRAPLSIYIYTHTHARMYMHTGVFVNVFDYRSPLSAYIGTHTRKAALAEPAAKESERERERSSSIQYSWKRSNRAALVRND